MLRRPLLVALGAGLLSATGFAPLDWWPVTLACLAVLLWLVHEAPTLRAVLLRSWVFGVGHFTVGNNWIQHAFVYQDKMPHALGYLAVVLLALYLAIYPMLAMGLAWQFKQRIRARGGWRDPDAGFVLAAAAAWIACEWLRGTMFTGYPWNPMAAIWLPTIGIARVAQWIGTYALSGVTILAAGSLLLAARRDFRMPALVLVGLVAAAFGNSGLPPAPTAPANGPHVRIVQPNIGQEGVAAADYPDRVLSKLIELSGRPGDAPRMLLWPEGMVNYYIEYGYPQAWYFRGDPHVVRARITALLGPRDMALVGTNALYFSGKGIDASGAANSVFALDRQGEIVARYQKAHLVPYGEYLPLRTILGPLGLARLVMGEIDFIPGPGPRTLNVPGFGKVGVQICYEIIFSGHVVDEAHRPDVIFNPSNDAWFGGWGPPQHLAQARLRAIEEGLPILRATPTGISAVVDADGRIVESLALHTAGAIDVPMPRPNPPTLFARWGNRMALLCVVFLGALAVAIRRLAR